MRTLLAAAALALAATPVPAATAGPAAAGPAPGTPTFGVPDVRRHVTGTAEVHLLATNRAVYRVTTSASMVYTDSTSRFSWLEVRVARCAKGACGTPVAYFTKLTEGTYKTADLKNVSVTVPAFGKPLTVVWSGAGPSGDTDSTPAAGAGAVEASSSWPATAKVTFLGITCTDAKAAAARRTTVYPTGFSEPEDMVPLPARTVPFGQPKAARSCRPGPA